MLYYLMGVFVGGCTKTMATVEAGLSRDITCKLAHTTRTWDGNMNKGVHDCQQKTIEYIIFSFVNEKPSSCSDSLTFLFYFNQIHEFLRGSLCHSFYF